VAVRQSALTEGVDRLGTDGERFSTSSVSPCGRSTFPASGEGKNIRFYVLFLMYIVLIFTFQIETIKKSEAPLPSPLAGRVALPTGNDG